MSLKWAQPEALSTGSFGRYPWSTSWQQKKWHTGGGWYPDGAHTFPYGRFSKAVLILQSEASRRLSSSHISGPGHFWVLLGLGWEMAARRVRAPPLIRQDELWTKARPLGLFSAHNVSNLTIFWAASCQGVFIQCRRQFLNPTNGKRVIL